MGINIGNNIINGAYWGSQAVQSIYMGNDEIWCDDRDIVYDEVNLDHIWSGLSILQTTDIHNTQVGDVGNSSVSPNWTLNGGGNSLQNLKTSLINNNIKTIWVDGGDWSRNGSSTSTNTQSKIMNQLLSGGCNLAVTGNNEYDTYDNGDISGLENLTTNILGNSNFVNNVLTCCNIKKKSSNTLIAKAYRAYKFKVENIGTVKLGIIGMCFPRWDDGEDRDAWLNAYDLMGYVSYDNAQWGDNLINIIQPYIDMFKKAGFDFIGLVVHNGYDADGSRFPIGVYDMALRLSGLDFVTMGHTHSLSNNIEVNNNSGSKTTIICQPRRNLMYVTRAILNGNKNNKSIQSDVFTTLSDALNYTGGYFQTHPDVSDIEDLS